MATRNIKTVNVGAVATQIVGANAARIALNLRIDTNKTVYCGHDAGVTIATGFPLSRDDGIVDDGAAPDAALYAICPGGNGVVRVWESFGP